MPEGIRINDVSLEISPSGLEALVNKQGADLTITRLDLSVSQEGLNTLLRGVTPEGQQPPTVQLADGRVRLANVKDGQTMGLDLQIGGLRLELSAGGLRLVSTAGSAGGTGGGGLRALGVSDEAEV